MKKKSVFLAACALTCVGGLSACGNDNDFDSNDGRVWGSGTSGLVNGSQSQSRFNNPVNVEVASDGTVYVADFDNDAIRVIATNGIVSTLTTTADVVAPATAFERPFGMTITPNGTLYVQTDHDQNGDDVDDEQGTIWHINRTNGDATMVATNLGRPRGLAAISNTQIAMSDPNHEVVTILTLTTPTTGAEGGPLAGAVDVPGFVDNPTGTTARFNQPYGLVVEHSGGVATALIVADAGNNRLRRVSLTGTNAVTTFAGGATSGTTNGALLTARFNRPQDVAIDETIPGSPVYFVADHNNYLIRRIASGTVTTFAGTGTKGFVDGDGTSAQFYGLEGIALEADGDVLWIADGTSGEDTPVPPYHRVRFLETP